MHRDEDDFLAIPKDAIYELVPERAAAQFGRLPPAVRALAKLCDGRRTLDGVVARSSLPREQAERIVARLLALGVLVEQRPFTDEEERFFASPIDHLVEEGFR